MIRSQQIFDLFLRAYPRDFRRDFGTEMVQVFNDCYRAEKKSGARFAVWRLWLLIILDMLRRRNISTAWERKGLQ
jgi:hypothetical protein